MASTSPATIPPDAMVEVPTPQVSCACGEIVADSEDGKELVLYTDDDGVGDVVETDSSEEPFPDENEVPIPVRAPPPGYALVHDQIAVRGCAGRSFCPYRFPYADRVDRRLARKDLLGEIADSARRRFKQKWGGEDLARNVRARVIELDDQLESDGSSSGSSPGSRRGPSPGSVQRVDSPVV